VSLLKKYIRINTRGIETAAARIPLKLNGWGYVDLSVRLSGLWESEGIKLLSDTVSGHDFDENGLSEITLAVYPAILKNRVTKVDVALRGDADDICHVVIVKEDVIKARISKQYFCFTDNGMLHIENFSGRNIELDIRSNLPFVKFESRQYNIGMEARIPFEIKLSAVQKSQYFFKKPPFIAGRIFVEAISGISFSTEFLICAGESYDYLQ